MNQQQIIKEILSFPIVVQKEIVEEVQKNIRRKVGSEDNKELSVEEKLKIVESLSGIAKVEGKSAPTDEEIKEDYAGYLAEKYK